MRLELRSTLARRVADARIGRMCGRIIQSGGALRYAIVDGMNVRDSRVHNYPPRWNAAPSQELLVIRRNHKTGEVSLDALRWGLIPYWCSDPKGGRKPINAHPGTRRFRALARRRARPRDLMRPFPSDPMRMWPVSTRVNTPENAAAAIIEPIELASDAA